MVDVDLRTKIIGPDHQVWVVHAGRAQRYFQTFYREEALFLGLSRLELSPEIVRNRNKVRQAIRMAQENNAFYEGELDRRPSENLRDYDSSTFEDGELTKLVGSVISLFHEAKPGDLIITPGYARVGTHRFPTINFGELVREFSPRDILRDVDQYTRNVPFRRVRWLATVPRRDIDVLIDRRIGKPPAVRRLQIDNESESILKFAYKNYIYDGSSTGFVSAPRYEASKFLTLTDANSIISTLVAAHEFFLVEGRGVSEIGNIERFTQEWFRRANVENIEVVFSSPGSWRVIASSVTLGAFISVGVSLLTSEASVNDLRSGVSVHNSLSATPEEEELIERSINMMLESIVPAELGGMKARSREASAEIGFQSPAQTQP